jgi:hypothetical protein
MTIFPAAITTNARENWDSAVLIAHIFKGACGAGREGGVG